MFLASPEMVKRIVEQSITEGLKEVETRRLLREAGMDRRSRISRQVRWLLSRMGHLFMTLGRLLERYEMPSVTGSTERQLACEAGVSCAASALRGGSIEL